MLKPVELIVFLYRKWRYYTFSKEEVESCSVEIRLHNAISLSVISVVTALLMLVLSFYPYETDQYHFLFYVFAGLEFANFIYIRYITTTKKVTSVNLQISLIIYLAAVAAFCVFIYGFCQSHYAERFLLVFLSFQIVFMYGPQVNLFLNAGITLMFFLVNYSTRQGYLPEYSLINGYYDVLNIFLASLISMTLNWYIALIVIKGSITSRNLVVERNRFKEDSTHDQLTGLNNRRGYDQSIDFYLSVCRHVHQTVCVLMMDVDHFKLYNDHYGHQKGDFVLKSLGNVLTKISEDEHLFPARVGGEEFIVIWTENRIDEAERVALKLRKMIIALDIEHKASTVAKYVTASFGLYIMRGGSMDSAAELYNFADTALYKAKESGRDCIILLDSADKKFRPVELRAPEAAGRR
ncbi:MAG: GGDEF domain-containing protein [Spirochaetaceae bacterium]|jgi:diguanylate cyclase (GGDEF)-like protein|nr:GGDEF domain-containing protein [Spirochaetaceae bacterium]